MISMYICCFVSILCSFLPGIHGDSWIDGSIKNRYHAVFQGGTQSVEARIIHDRGSRPGHVIERSHVPLPSGTQCRHIDLKPYNKVLFFNKENMTVTCDCGVTMDTLVTECMKQGVIPKVVAEFPEITVGGAIVGCALESSSWKYGVFHDTVKRVLVYCGGKDAVICERDGLGEVLRQGQGQGQGREEGEGRAEDTAGDLWRGLCGSYGTLGTVLCAEIECVPLPSNHGTAQETDATTTPVDANIHNIDDVYVMLEIHAFQTVDAAFEMIAKTVEDDNQNVSHTDFIDALLFPDEGGCAALIGKLTILVSTKPIKDMCEDNMNMKMKIETFDPLKFASLWFYEKIENILRDSRRLPSPLADNVINPITSTITNAVTNATTNAKNVKESHSHNSASAISNSLCMTLKMPLRSYLFRYDKGAFWASRPMKFSWSAIKKSPFTFFLFLATDANPLSRILFRFILTTKNLYSALRLAHPTVLRKRFIFSDFFLPSAHATLKFVQSLRDKVPLTVPLWICPVRKPFTQLQHDQLLSPHALGFTHPLPSSSSSSSPPSTSTSSASSSRHNDLSFDVGVYGRVTDDNGETYSRHLTLKSLELGGRTMLYSQNFLTEHELWNLNFPPQTRERYRQLRRKYNIDVHFPELDHKLGGPMLAPTTTTTSTTTTSTTSTASTASTTTSPTITNTISATPTTSTTNTNTNTDTNTAAATTTPTTSTTIRTNTVSINKSESDVTVVVEKSIKYFLSWLLL